MIYEDVFMMQIIYFLVTAVALYWVSDKIIDLAEKKRASALSIAPSISFSFSSFFHFPLSGSSAVSA
ncbi:hypothetical protein DF3PB_20031 [uncultured Defluviicoccus sp.]|uniref:Uncharacterized protein n=1 Tax=metagenome TaxID=256318 RepID=A0A380TBH5_9ZZZZ|nr:hypothetical protein DF3PB_20031 [uncultured Defluviicoccus sp.]